MSDDDGSQISDWESDDIQELVSNSDNDVDSDDDDTRRPIGLDSIINQMSTMNVAASRDEVPCLQLPPAAATTASTAPAAADSIVPAAAATAASTADATATGLTDAVSTAPAATALDSAAMSRLPPLEPQPAASYPKYRAFDQLLSKYSIPKASTALNAPCLTHLSMNGGRYHLPPNNDAAADQFLKLFFECVVKDNYRGKGRYLVESVSQIVAFYYFLDFDFSQEEWIKMVFIADNKDNIYKMLRQVILKNLSQARGSPVSADELVFSIRFPWKIHVNVDGYIVSSGKAAKLTESIKKDIIHLWHQQVINKAGVRNHDDYIAINFDKVIDSSVYRTGLRMIGSIKKTADGQVKQLNRFLASSHHPDDATALLDGTTDLVDSYFIINVDTGAIVRYEDLTFEQFKKTLIRPYTEERWDAIETIGRSCATANSDFKIQLRNNTTAKQKIHLRSINGQPADISDSEDDDNDGGDQFMTDTIEKDVMILREIKKVAFNIVSTAAPKRTVKDDFFTYIVHDDEVKLPIVNALLVGEVQDHLYALKQAIFDKTFPDEEQQQPFNDYDFNVVSVKVFRTGSDIYLHVEVADHRCPFIGRAHTRSSNPIYLNLFADGQVQLRCFDDQCRQEKYPIKKLRFPYDRKHQYIYHAFNCNVLPAQVYKMVEGLLYDNSSDLKISEFIYYLFRKVQATKAKANQCLFYKFTPEKHKWTEYVCFQDQIMKQVPGYIEVYMKQMMLKHLFVIKQRNLWHFDETAFQNAIGGKGELKDVHKAFKAITEKKLQNMRFVGSILPGVGSKMLNDYMIKYPEQLPFDERLDSNPHLMVFKNGVFDFDACTFRNGRRDDYCSISLDFDYLDFDDDKTRQLHLATIGEVERYFVELFPDEQVRDYMMNVVARALWGKPDEKFYICVGNGSNGKSFFFNLFERMLKSYAVQLPVTIFTQKRGASENATPVLTRLKAKRVCLLQEPEKDDVIHAGLLKLLSGGDKITARKLFSDPIEFVNQSTFLLAANIVPKIGSTDGGTWRRIRIIPFAAKFVKSQRETIDVENAVVIDPEFEKKTAKWHAVFISYFIQRFKKLHAINPLIVFDEPPQVLEMTENEQGSSSMLLKFINDLKIIKMQDGQFYSIEKLCEYMSLYLEINGQRFDTNGYNRQSLLAFMRQKYGEPMKQGNDHFVKGFYLKMDQDVVTAMLAKND